MVNTIKVLGAEGSALVNPFYVSQGANAIARPEDLFFLALVGDSIVGAVRFCIEEGAPMLRSMMVHRDHRQQGIGRILLKEFDDYLNAKSYRDTHCLPYGHLVGFYGLIGFEKRVEVSAPAFLIERLADYRAKNPTTDYIYMRRP